MMFLQGKLDDVVVVLVFRACLYSWVNSSGLFFWATVRNLRKCVDRTRSLVCGKCVCARTHARVCVCVCECACVQRLTREKVHAPLSFPLNIDGLNITSTHKHTKTHHKQAEYFCFSTRIFLVIYNLLYTNTHTIITRIFLVVYITNTHKQTPQTTRIFLVFQPEYFWHI